MTKRVLIVDDDPDLCELLVALYEEPGKVDCSYANSFDQVRVKMSGAKAFDLIVLDLNLGPAEPDGIVIHSWLKETEFSGRIAFLTGHGKFHPNLKALCAVDGIPILEKPAGVSELKGLIDGFEK